MMKIYEKPTRKDPNKRPISPRKRRWLIITLVIVLAVGGILYSLADRYLIRHVQVIVADENTATATTGNANDSSSTTTTTTEVNATSDDWNYSVMI